MASCNPRQRRMVLFCIFSMIVANSPINADIYIFLRLKKIVQIGETATIITVNRIFKQKNSIFHLPVVFCIEAVFCCIALQQKWNEMDKTSEVKKREILPSLSSTKSIYSTKNKLAGILYSNPTIRLNRLHCRGKMYTSKMESGMVFRSILFRLKYTLHTILTWIA